MKYLLSTHFVTLTITTLKSKANDVKKIAIFAVEMKGYLVYKT